MQNHEVENNIIELQSKIAFQEDLIHHLNVQVAELTSECMELKKQFRQVNQKIDSLNTQWEQIIRSDFAEKPPHY